MENSWDYSSYNSMNRYENIDSLEAKIIEHLIHSHSKHTEMFWKILKYNDLYALSQPEVTEAERRKLVNNDNGDITSKRLFLSPFVDDAWEEQCSSVYIFVSGIKPINHLTSIIGVTVETIVHSKISAISGDGDPLSNPSDEENGIYGANPNESDEQDSVVVLFKNRATVLLKCVLAELNGLYLDGFGYLQFNAKTGLQGKDECSLFNNRSFYGHSTVFQVSMTGVSDTAEVGY